MSKPIGAIALERAAAAWWTTMLLGQWAFLTYIVAFYGVSLVTGTPEVWNRLGVFGRTPYVPGDLAGNLAFAAHALGAGIVAFGGALQLLPGLRARAPAFHRWNGRVFLVTVVALALSGFYLVWLRGEPPTTLREASTSINGALILAFAALAFGAIRRRDVAAHRRWAMRLYLVSNAQWFLRVGLFAFFALSGPLGLGANERELFMHLWTFGCYLVPLAVLECYLRADARGGAAVRRATAALLVGLTALMAVGIVVYGLFARKIAIGAPLGFG